MIKNSLILLLFVFAVWLSKDYIGTDLPTQISDKNSDIAQKTEHGTKHVEKQEINTDLKPSEVKPTLSELLAKGLFYDALAYYLDENTVTNMKQIEAYLANLAQTDPPLALKYMQVFLDNEPQSTVSKLMIKTYIGLGDFPKAIELIIQAKEDYVSEAEDKRLATQLKEVALKQIDTLFKRKEYEALITFLEDMIAYDSTDSFYSFRLAQLYMFLDKTQEAAALFETLQYDEVYAQKVQSLLQSVDTQNDESYAYAIPLQNYGSHYTLDVSLDGTLFTLMLDTGASYIFIDEEKASMFDVVKNVTLQTAGNDISAKLCQVSTLQAGNLQLSNIAVTVAPFKRDGIDGLLGMNFFKQFSFYIDQEENILYLNPKSTSR